MKPFLGTVLMQCLISSINYVLFDIIVAVLSHGISQMFYTDEFYL